MPATTKHIQINFDRISELPDVDDTGRLRVLAFEAQAANTTVTNEADTANIVDLSAAWATFVTAADEAKIAHLIPGTVGKQFAAKYGITKERTVRDRKVSATVKLTPAQADVASALFGALVTAGKRPPAEVAGQVMSVYSVPSTTKTLESAVTQLDNMTDKAKAARIKASLDAMLRKLEDPAL